MPQGFCPMKNLLPILLFLFSCTLFGQVRQLQKGDARRDDFGLNTNNRDIGEAPRSVIDNRERPPISDYNIISSRGDTTFVDTTLTIRKDYKYNYLRKDNFELLPFSNVGRPYTRLGHKFDKVQLMPEFGARARHFSYLEVEDIYYYHVPTPLTELFFKTVFEQGQILDAFFSTNASPQTNFFIAYKGLHSLGRFQHIRTSMGNFRAGISHHTKNKRYVLKTHFTSQDLSSEENGGLSKTAIQNYKEGVEEFDDRSLLEVNFQDASNLLLGRRFYLDHYFMLIQDKDSIFNNSLRIGHTLNFTDKEYRYDQAEASPLFGEPYETKNLRDETEFQQVSNLLYLEYENRILGKLQAKISHSDYNYGYRRVIFNQNSTIPNRLTGDVFAAGAGYEKKIGDFDVRADAMLNITDDFTGSYIRASAGYDLPKIGRAQAGVLVNSHAPNYNFLLYQSDYKNYNWRNNFDNIKVQSLSFDLVSEKFVNAGVTYTQIEDYAYFGLIENPDASSVADTLVKPFQYSGSVSYLKLKVNKEFDFGLFALDNTLMYQNVSDGKEVFRVPDFVTRNSFYYKDYWFERALYLQTGFTFNYFTSFKANAYDPVLAEFYVQDWHELEGFATVDFFFNAKVDQARIYFSLENLTDLFMGNTSFAAPGYAARDFGLRFGIVWNFFL